MVERAFVGFQVAVPEGEDKGKARLQATNRFNDITQQLSTLSNNFSNNALDATAAFKLLITDKKDLDGLPGSFLAQAAQRVCLCLFIKMHIIFIFAECA